MNITREDWWATPIWFFDIPVEVINPTNIEKECYLLKNKSEGKVVSNVDGWQSEDICRDKITFNVAKLLDEIEIQSKSIFKEHGLKSNINIAISNSWVNINPKGSSNIAHSHPESVMSGVYYIKANQNSGDIIFYGDPRLEFYNQLYFDTKNKNTHEYVVYKPIVGRVLIFPPWLLHAVMTNKSEGDRISIAFNFGIKQ
jgi:uncharacterized protein (TIGR02466 family)